MVRLTTSAKATLIEILSDDVDRPILDATGLTGLFDVHLEFAAGGGVGSAAPPDVATAAPAADSAGPSIFAAVQEQLGLRLKSARRTIEVLAIDHVERPSED